MLRPNTQLPIVPFAIAGQEARFVTYNSVNESLSSFGYLDADKNQVASRTIILPDGVELTEENILSAAGVKLAGAGAVAKADAAQPAKG